MIWGCWVRSSLPVSSYPMNASIILDRGRRVRRLATYVTRRNCVNCLGTWSVRGMNGIAKIEQVVDVSREGKFEHLGFGFPETKE